MTTHYPNPSVNTTQKPNVPEGVKSLPPTCTEINDMLLDSIRASFANGAQKNSKGLTLTQIEHVLEIPNPFPAGTPASKEAWNAELKRVSGIMAKRCPATGR